MRRSGIGAFALVLSLGLAGGLARAQAPSGAAPSGLVVGSGNFFSPIVADLDAAVAFYRDGLGLDVQGPPADADDNLPLRNMFGLPDARIRWTIARPPGMSTGVEIVEISGAGGQPLERRLQDPGAVTLIVLVRDLDSILERLKSLGAPVVSPGGAPAAGSYGAQQARMVTVEDPAGHFVEIVQPERMPATQAPETANVVDVRVRLTVEDSGRSMQLYRDALGLAVSSEPPLGPDRAAIAASPGVGAVRGADLATTSLEVPTSGLTFELIEFIGSDRRPVRARLQDPGSTRMQLRVSDIDAAVAAFEHAGGEVVSTGGTPLELPVPNGSIKVAIVRDPDNLFVVLIEAPPADD
jgi:catechol 2,3-dioxygenase-like lactoylglutathione lyase family enzyme